MDEGRFIIINVPPEIRSGSEPSFAVSSRDSAVLRYIVTVPLGSMTCDIVVSIYSVCASTSDVFVYWDQLTDISKENVKFTVIISAVVICIIRVLGGSLEKELLHN